MNLRTGGTLCIGLLLLNSGLWLGQKAGWGGRDVRRGVGLPSERAWAPDCKYAAPRLLLLIAGNQPCPTCTPPPAVFYLQGHAAPKHVASGSTSGANGSLRGVKGRGGGGGGGSYRIDAFLQPKQAAPAPGQQQQQHQRR